MMATDPNMAGLLLNQECPFDNQCKAIDCMKCIEIHKEGKDHG